MERQNSKTLAGFKAAVSLILDGEVSAGLEQLETVEGQDIFKNMVKAEIAYYKDDLKMPCIMTNMPCPLIVSGMTLW